MSNVYPVWWDTAITVFNRYQDPQTQVITWYSTQLQNCFWKYTGDKLTIGETVLETNGVLCRIPKNDKFKEKYLWISTPNDQMSNYFTLAQGDIIVRGAVDDVVNEYQSGHRSSDLLAKYKALQGCMEVQTVTINTGAGRCAEHYYVRGI